MDETLAALQFAYEEARRSQSLLRQRLADVRIIGTPEEHDGILRALVASDEAAEEAARALSRYTPPR